MTFAVEQRSWVDEETWRSGEGKLWDWDVWIEARRGSLQDVDHVVYSLHPAFPSPNRIVRDPAGGFKLEVRSGTPGGDTWGTFPLAVRVVLRDGAFVRFRVHLDLRDPEGHPVAGLLDPPANGSLTERLRLADRLKKKGAFGYARAVLQGGRTHPAFGADPAATETVVQQEALCTYKDPLLPLDTRLARALRILDGCAGGLAATLDPETLGLAGAVHKRLWELDGQRRNLDRALHYYSRGYAAMTRAEAMARPDYDAGAYTGGNAAFVADLLDCEEQAGGGRGVHAAEARRIRSELVARLQAAAVPQKWWYWASLAEARLGLAPLAPEHYERARDALRSAMALPSIDDWQRESTATQLSALVDLQCRVHGEAAARGWDVIGELVPENRTALRRPVRGKIGLALSGGGFRASLFHIGVLARLAELDLLREVEVLSCVSGGSIVGAHYYLELRRLMHAKTDREISPEDYVGIVRALERKFLAGVQTNIRVRLAASLAANWRMLLRPRRYSRTRRTGELYEELIFSGVEDGEQSRARWLNDLFVTPVVEDGTRRRLDGEFSPKLHNWRRRAKIPVLVLNATTLNTGRNWQFTASSMGESTSYGTGIDATERLEPVYYGEAPEGHTEMRLGHAVAASSCVPGLFDPLVLERLYDGRTVRLVDGGVHDNQGTRALLDQDCTLLLVSDASGQMAAEPDPSNTALGVVLRTNAVLQARLRVAQHQEIDARRRSQLVREEMLVHLKLGLESPPVTARNAPPNAPAAEGAGPPAETTSYGVRRDVQAALAGLRTDLDSFTDREAYALMTSGYRITERVLGGLSTFGSLADCRRPWRFLALEPALQGRPAAGVDPESLLTHLRVGRRTAFKVWSLHPGLRVLRAGLALAVVLGLLWRAAVRPHVELAIGFDLRKLLLAGIVLFGLFGPFRRAADFVQRWIDVRGTLTRMGVGLAMGGGGFLLAWLHLAIVDRWFKALGHVEAEPTVARPLPR